MYLKRYLQKRLMVAGITIMVLSITIIASSYALFMDVKSNTNDQVLSVGDLQITYLGGSAINVNPIDPMSDSNALNETNNVYTFSIENTGNLAYCYSVSIINNPDYLVGGSSYNASTTLLSHNYIRYSVNGDLPATLGDANQGVVYVGTLNPTKIKLFNIRLWVGDPVTYNLPNSALNSEIHLNITVDGKACEKQITFAYTFGGSGSENFASVQQTSDGGYIAVGNSNSTDQDMQSLNKGVSDAIIVKYDSSGNVTWKKTFGGSSVDYFLSVQQTSDGGYIAVGNSESANQDLSGLNKGEQDAIIVKYDSSGNVTWKKSFGGSSDNYFESVQQTSDGGYIAVGSSNSTDQDMQGLNKGSNDAIIVKYDSSGNVTWKKTFGGSSVDYFVSVQQTSDGGYIAVGNSESANQDLSGLNKGNYDAIIVKYDSSGNVTWKKTFGGSNTETFSSVQQTSDGGYIAVGNSNSTDQDMQSLNKGGTDAIIVKYDSSGNVTWKKTFGGSSADYFISVQQTSDGGYIAVGYFESNDQDMQGLNKGDWDAIIVKYDSSGNVTWKKCFGGSSFNSFVSIQQTSDGGYIAVGSSNSTDQDLAGLNKGGNDAIIVKFDSLGNFK